MFYISRSNTAVSLYFLRDLDRVGLLSCHYCFVIVKRAEYTSFSLSQRREKAVMHGNY